MNCVLDSRHSYATWLWAEQLLRAQGAQSFATDVQAGAQWISVFGHIRKKWAWLADLTDEHLALSQPIPVELHLGANSVAAYSYELDELSVGADEASALDEIRAMIAESFRILKAEKGNLGPLQRRHWQYLSRVAKEV